MVRRVLSIVTLVTIDVVGLVIGLYAALAVRALVFDPKPILWGLLWTHETDWLAFLLLLLVLVFWRAGLYAPRELREGAGRVVPSVFLVSALSLVFAIGTGQEFTTFGLYIAGAALVAALISGFRWSYDVVTEVLLRRLGARRRVVLVGDEEQVGSLRESLGSTRSGIDYAFVGETPAGPELYELIAREPVDEIVVADAGLEEAELLELVDRAHRRGVRVRVAP